MTSSTVKLRIERKFETPNSLDNFNMLDGHGRLSLLSGIYTLPEADIVAKAVCTGT